MFIELRNCVTKEEKEDFRKIVEIANSEGYNDSNYFKTDNDYYRFGFSKRDGIVLIHIFDCDSKDIGIIKSYAEIPANQIVRKVEFIEESIGRTYADFLKMVINHKYHGETIEIKMVFADRLEGEAYVHDLKEKYQNLKNSFKHYGIPFVVNK